MKIEGTVTISLETLYKLQQEAEEGEKAQRKLCSISEEITGMIGFEDEEYKKKLEEIDNKKNLTEKQLEREVSKALALLVIVVDKDRLKTFIQKHIEEISENHYDLKNATLKELGTMQIKLLEKMQEGSSYGKKGNTEGNTAESIQKV